MQLRHGQLNHVFELAGVNYQPRLELIAHATKRRWATTAVVEPPSLKKTSGEKGRTWLAVALPSMLMNDSRFVTNLAWLFFNDIVV
jgi:predicted TIM-barrel enzyme